jgi:hypothetical protein
MISAKQAHRATVMNHKDVDSNGILIDINVQSITDSGQTREDKTHNIDDFFGKLFEHAGANSTVKNTVNARPVCECS